MREKQESCKICDITKEREKEKEMYGKKEKEKRCTEKMYRDANQNEMI